VGPRVVDALAAANVRRLVAQLVSHVLGVPAAEVGSHVRFREDIGVDSYDLAELAMEAQDRFGAEISHAALETVGDFGRCVMEAMASGNGSDPLARMKG
jgi:acyl carrier protein